MAVSHVVRFTIAPSFARWPEPMAIILDMFEDVKHMVLGGDDQLCTVSDDDHTLAGHLQDLRVDATRLLPYALALAVLVAAVVYLPAIARGGGTASTNNGNPVPQGPVVVVPSNTPTSTSAPTFTPMPTFTPTQIPSTATPTVAPTETVAPSATVEMNCNAGICFEKGISAAVKGCLPMGGTWPEDLPSLGPGMTYMAGPAAGCDSLLVLPARSVGEVYGWLVFRMPTGYVKFHVIFPAGTSGQYPAP